MCLLSDFLHKQLNVRGLFASIACNPEMHWYKNPQGKIEGKNIHYEGTISLEDLNTKVSTVMKKDQDALAYSLGVSKGYHRNIQRSAALDEPNDPIFIKKVRQAIINLESQQKVFKIYTAALKQRLKEIEREVEKDFCLYGPFSSPKGKCVEKRREMEEGEIDPEDVSQAAFAIDEDFSMSSKEKIAVAFKEPEPSKDEKIAGKKRPRESEQSTPLKSAKESPDIPAAWEGIFFSFGYVKGMPALLKKTFDSLKGDPVQFKKLALYGAEKISARACLIFVADAFEGLEWPSAQLKQETIPEMFRILIRKFGIISEYKGEIDPARAVYAKLSINIPHVFSRRANQVMSENLAKAISEELHGQIAVKHASQPKNNGVEFFIDSGSIPNSQVGPLLTYLGIKKQIS